MREIDVSVIHCSATRENSSFSFKQCKDFHMKKRGYRDIGYHYYIEKDGSLHLGRDLKTPGAHVKGHNSNSIGICYEGGLDVNGKGKDTRTELQKTTMTILLCHLLTIFPNMDIKGHRDFSPDLDGDGVIEKNEWVKLCPCFSVKDEYGNLIKK